MIKYVAISLIAIFLMACTGNKNSYFSEEEKEDSNAKEMLQGIWLDDETERSTVQDVRPKKLPSSDGQLPTACPS